MASGELTCRSLLPYDLTFVMHRELEDPGRARAAGPHGRRPDRHAASGRSRADGAAASPIFDEDVEVGSGLLRAAGRLLRPALRFHHDHMMRAGEKGLRAYLA